MNSENRTTNNAPSSQDEKFIRLHAKYESQLRHYLRAMLPTAQDVDEVIQNTSVIAWRKFDQLTEPEGFPRWICVIGKYEAMKYRRTMARDRIVLDDELVSRIAEEGLEESELREKQLATLQSCLSKLPEDRRRILMAVYTPGESVKKLAEAAGKTPQSMYMMVNRLRHSLFKCMKEAIANT